MAVRSPALEWQAVPLVTCWRLANQPGWAWGNGMVSLALCTFLIDLRSIPVALCRTAERILSSASRPQRRTPWQRRSGQAVIAGRPGPAAVRSRVFLFRRKVLVPESRSALLPEARVAGEGRKGLQALWH